MPKMTPANSKLTYVATALAILGLLWQAANSWQELKYRVKSLESKELFLHGDITIPKG